MIMLPIRLVCLDMAGTTVRDDGAVMSAFAAAMDAVGIGVGTGERERAVAYTLETMGTAKIEVFRHLTASEERAQTANTAFESAYLELINSGAVAPLPGAAETIGTLRQAGIKVAFTTGFSPQTRQAVLQALDWQQVADLALSPADAGRGRPYPDMILTAFLRLGLTDVRGIANLGDTAADVHSGLRSGAVISAGVRTGSHGAAELTAAGATHILDSVADLPAVLEL